ncbi:hypothetical protein QCD60_28320 [Pokkaliibacter sp. MBI-7]|uniref:hypothetical protein n=1 Tax=Pokkaliibacter sp. MBI-7 TaxID=3040600 RepID=UPI0024474522|nr:hypothetical protein [Pokkaliibacter sp. MBI-7]MDH2436427.1 hypothetical protein [Pokkaliibacter sp. MBI-7]
MAPLFFMRAIVRIPGLRFKWCSSVEMICIEIKQDLVGDWYLWTQAYTLSGNLLTVKRSRLPLKFEHAWEQLQCRCLALKARGFRRLASDEMQIELPFYARE